MRRWFKVPVTSWPRFESYSCHFVYITIHSIVFFILDTCTWYVLPSFMLLIIQYTGRIAEWSKVLVSGTSHSGGLGSSPTPLILLTFLYTVLFHVFWTPEYDIFYHHECCWTHNLQAGWRSAMRRWFKAPVTFVVRVQVPVPSFCWHNYT